MIEDSFKKCSFEETDRLLSVIQKNKLKCSLEYYFTGNEEPFCSSSSNECLEVEYFKGDALVVVYGGFEHIFKIENSECSKSVDISSLELLISNERVSARFLSHSIPECILKKEKLLERVTKKS